MKHLLLLLLCLALLTGCAVRPGPEPVNSPTARPEPVAAVSPAPSQAPSLSPTPAPIPALPTASPSPTPGEAEQRADRMWADLERFTKTHRLAGTQGEIDALSAAAGLFYSLGYTVQTQTVTRAEPTRMESFNIIGVKPAAVENAPVLILNAHADSVEMGPGATDNAGGLAVLLECARAAAALELPGLELRFIAFCAEEWQATGSAEYVSVLSRTERERIIGVLTLDMFSSKNAPFPFGYYENPASQGFFKKVSQAARDVGLLFGYDTSYQMMSDATPFEAADIPAVLVTQIPVEEEYHTANDSLECVDPARLEFAYQLAMAVIGRCAA